MRTTLQELISTGDPIIADGAMGTMLFAAGLEHGGAPELWNVEKPDEIRKVHRAYIEAGSQIVLTNTFGGNSERLKMHNLQDRVAEFNTSAAELAGHEAEAAGHPVVVAGDIGPSGSLLEPYGDLSYDRAVEVFAEQAAALAAGGVDVLWIETMSDLNEVRAAVEGARKAAPELPLVTTMTFDTNGHTMFGVSPEKAIHELGTFDMLALGGNCGNGLAEIENVVQKMHDVNASVVLVAKANAGIPVLKNGVPVYDGTPEKMGDYAVRVRGLGATIIGACCGSTPDHVRAIAQAVKAK